MKISELKSHGLTVELKKGNLHIGGFKTLPPDVAARVRQAVVEHRDTIIAELSTAPDAASLPQAVAGTKPCDQTPGLPCLGEQGTCFSRPYWEGKTFDVKNIRRKASELDTCPSAERVEQYISEPRDQIVADLAATEKPEDVQDTDAERAYLELVEQVRSGHITLVEYPNAWLRPLLCGRIDALAVQDLFQRALPALASALTRIDPPLLIKIDPPGLCSQN